MRAEGAPVHWGNNLRRKLSSTPTTLAPATRKIEPAALGVPFGGPLLRPELFQRGASLSLRNGFLRGFFFGWFWPWLTEALRANVPSPVWNFDEPSDSFRSPVMLSTDVRASIRQMGRLISSIRKRIGNFHNLFRRTVLRHVITTAVRVLLNPDFRIPLYKSFSYNREW